MQIIICSHISVETQIWNFMKIKPTGAVCSVQIKEGWKEGRLDRQTVRYEEHNSHFAHLVNATKKLYII
jgi:hypothetical protein